MLVVTCGGDCAVYIAVQITNLADNEDIVCILTRIVTNLIPQIPNKYRQVCVLVECVH